MRYGLEDGVTHTLDECAIAVGSQTHDGPVGRERIRQIEHRALRLLGNFARKEALIDAGAGFAKRRHRRPTHYEPEWKRAEREREAADQEDS